MKIKEGDRVIITSPKFALKHLNAKLRGRYGRVNKKNQVVLDKGIKWHDRIRTIFSFYPHEIRHLTKLEERVMEVLDNENR